MQDINSANIEITLKHFFSGTMLPYDEMVNLTNLARASMEAPEGDTASLVLYFHRDDDY